MAVVAAEPAQAVLSLIGDHSLFQETILRTSALPGAQPPVTVCSEEHRFMVGEQLQAIGIASGGIVLEPVARNTAPAIALAAPHVLAADQEATILVLPDDHLIEDAPAFRDAVARALRLGSEGWLVAFGFRPDYAETGYGSILRGEALGEDGYRIGRFVEKPDLATVERYLADGSVAWNSGMFLFDAATHLENWGGMHRTSCPLRHIVCGGRRRAGFHPRRNRGIRRKPERLDRLRGDGTHRPRSSGAGELRLERHRLVVVAVIGGAAMPTEIATRVTLSRSTPPAAWCAHPTAG